MDDTIEKITQKLDKVSKIEDICDASHKLKETGIDLKCKQFKINFAFDQRLKEHQDTKKIRINEIKRLLNTSNETENIENIFYYQEQIKKILNINQMQNQKVLDASKLTKEEQDKKLDELDKNILEIAQKNKKLYEKKLELSNKVNMHLNDIEELKKSILKMRIFNSKKSDELINTFAKNDKEFKNIYKKFNLFQNLLKYRILDIKENDNNNLDIKGYFVDSNNARLKYFPMSLNLENEDPIVATKRVQDFWLELHEFFKPRILNSKSDVENIEPNDGNVKAGDYEVINYKFE